MVHVGGINILSTITQIGNMIIQQAIPGIVALGGEICYWIIPIGAIGAENWYYDWRN
jgi:hypothetical protein